MRRTSRSIKVDVPPDATPADAWGRGEIYQQQTFSGEDRPKRKGESRHPCPCPCRCGATATESRKFCYLCSRDIHHTCSRACAEFQPMPVMSQREYARNVAEGGDVEKQDWRGSKAGSGQSAYIPPRRPCDGGKYKERSAKRPGDPF